MKNKVKLPKAKDGHWIQGAVNPKHKGFCTPMTKSTCTPKRKALARTFKKHHGFHKEDGGSMDPNAQNMPMPEQGQAPAQGTPQQGGQQQMEQLMAMVAQALQQGTPPEQVVQMLTQQGVPPEQAQQVVQQVMQQLQSQGGEQQEPAGQLEQQEAPQGEPQMRYGGIKRAEIGVGLDGNLNDKWGPRAQQDLLASQMKFTPPVIDPNIIDPNSPAPQYSQTPPNPNMIGDLAPTAPAYDPRIAKQLDRHDQYKQGFPNSRNNGYDQFGTITGLYPGYDLSKAIEYGRDIKRDNMGLESETDPAKRAQMTKDRNWSIAGTVGHSLAAGINTALPVINGFLNLAKERRNRSEYQQNMQRIQRDNANMQPYSPGYETRGGNLPMSRNGRKINPCMDCGGKMDIGGKLGYLEDGGVPPNVITEQGEVINNTDSVYKDGGVKHSHPSGGNAKHLMPGSVVHSASLGMQVGDLVGMLTTGQRQFADGGQVDNGAAPDDINGYVLSKLQELSPKKKLSFAKIAGLFKTDEQDKGIKLAGKKLAKEEMYATSPDETSISKVTSKFNQESLKDRITALQREKELNLAATGPDGPLYQIAEGLKRSGHYGEDVKNEALAQDQAKYGKMIHAGNGTGISQADLDLWKTVQYGDVSKNPKLQELAKRVRSLPDIDARIKEAGSPGSSAGLTDDELLALFNENKYDLSKFAGSSATASTNGTFTIPVEANPKVSIPGTDYPREGIKNIYDQMYRKGDNPRQEQKQLGFDKGFNTTSWLNNPEGFMQALAHTGYSPEDWSKVTNEDIQKHLFDQGLKAENEPIMKALYNTFLETNQGTTKSGKKYSAPWSTLSEKEKRDWFEDGYNGIRTDFATRLLQPNAPLPSQNPAAQTTTVPPATGVPPLGGLPTRTAGKRLYTEGLAPWEVAGPVMGLLTGRDVTPLIEDTGAKDALAANTRRKLTDIQPQLNRLTRGTLAQTRGVGSDPVSMAQQAQAYSNEYEQANQVYGDKYNRDAQIDDANINQQNQLRMAAGSNRAKALDLLAQREATSRWKKTALDINSVGDLADRFGKQRLENRASLLYQDMFPNAGYNGYVTNGVGSPGSVPLIGGGGSQSLYPSKDNVTTEFDAQGNVIKVIKHDFQDPTVNPVTGKPYGKKMGGKIKLPSTSIKRKKSVK